MRKPKKLRSLAVDANPILSAVIGGRARAVFQIPSLRLVTTEFTIREVIGHIPELAAKMQSKGADVLAADLHFALVAAPLTIYGQEFYRVRLEDARRRIEKRDPDDVDLLALALKLSIPIWTNDQDYSVSGVKWYSTQELLNKIKSLVQ